MDFSQSVIDRRDAWVYSSRTGLCSRFNEATAVENLRARVKWLRRRKCLVAQGVRAVELATQEFRDRERRGSVCWLRDAAHTREHARAPLMPMGQLQTRV